MPAADIQSLLDFEAEIETAIKAACTAASVTAAIHREDTDNATPFVTVEFVQGASLGHLHKHSDGIFYNDKFEGEVLLTIVTECDTNNATHATYRKKLREIMQQWQKATTGINARLTYLRLLDCKSAGNTPRVSADDNTDISAMRYTTPFEIRSDAWPA